MGGGMEQKESSLITRTVRKLDKAQTSKELTVQGKPRCMTEM